MKSKPVTSKEDIDKAMRQFDRPKIDRTKAQEAIKKIKDHFRLTKGWFKKGDL